MKTGVSKRGSNYEVQLNKEQAAGSRDALSKSLYSKLFDWIVHSINSTMSKLANGLGKGKILSIGVLDIFGFEIFKVELVLTLE